MDIFRVAGIAAVTALLALTVRGFKPDMGMQVALAGGIVLLIIAAVELSTLSSSLRSIFSGIGFDEETFSVAVKIVGIAYIGQIAADICRDAGETALASKTEICSRILMTSAALPVMIRLMKLLTALISDHT